MATLKTQPTNVDPGEFIEKLDNEKRKKDALELLEMMTRISGEKPVMWGPAIIGFGNYHYKYESGREGEWFEVGFSPRKASLSVYIMTGYKKFHDIMDRLGKYKTGASCLYINKLDDIDRSALEELLQTSIDHIRSSE